MVTTDQQAYQVRFLATPHPAQLEVFDRPERFRCLIAGTRFGKTFLAAMEALRFGLARPRSLVRWVAPSYKLADSGWDTVHQIAGPGVITGESKSYPKEVTLLTGSRIEFMSAERAFQLRAVKVDFLIVDEARWVRADAWTALRTRLMDSKAPVLIITTPGGIGTMAYRYWADGQDPLKPDYWSATFPTTANPYMDAAEVEAAREWLGERVAAQELEAQWVEEANVFRRVREWCDLPCPGRDTPFLLKGGLPVGECVAGVDLARLRDFTVVSILDSTGCQVALDRFRHRDWPEQIARIAALLRQHSAHAVCDSTGVGDPVVQYLEQEVRNGGGFSVEPYQFTEQSKRDLIDQAVIQSERGRIHLFAWEPQIAELESYGYELTERGRVRYASALGHDDMVMAHSLACWGFDKRMTALESHSYAAAFGQPTAAGERW